MNKRIGISASAALVGLVLAGCGDGQGAPGGATTAAGGGALLIEGATLIDGKGGTPLADSAILIEGERITAVGRKGEIARPDGARVIDATGKFITPGLIDAKANYASNMGEAYIHFGVTSGIWSGGGGDAGYAERDAINNGVFTGPRLFTSYTAIATPGEFAFGSDIPGSYGYMVNTPEEARALSIKILDSGAEFISAGDGNGPPEIFAPMVEEAHKRGKAAVMRTVGPGVGALECARIGCDVVIHTGNIGNKLARDEAKWKDYVALPPDQYAEMDDAKAPAIIKEMVDAKLALEPDLIATGRGFPKNWARVQEEAGTWHNNDAALLSYFPAYQQAGYVANVADPSTYLTPEQLETRRLGFQNHVRFLKMFVDAGGHILPASDIPQSPPGLGVHQEMAVFVEDVGLTPMQAIQSATSWAAQHFWLNDLGTIEAGKLADLIIVTADPTVDILNLRKIDTVIKGGQVQDRTYHADYLGKTFQAGLFDGGICCFSTPVVEGFGFFGEGKVPALKAVSGFLQQPWVDGWAGGGPPSLDTALPGTPAIEGIRPWVVNEGSPTTTVTLTGFNFSRRTKAYVGDQEAPIELVSPTEARVTVDAALLKPGTHFVTLKTSGALSTPTWGDTSNRARLLVPTRFTTKHSNNEF